jgi:hypothetical protein
MTPATAAAVALSSKGELTSVLDGRMRGRRNIEGEKKCGYFCLTSM